MTARCLCGDVAWRAEGPVDLVSHCHCSICRKFHGSAFATFGTFQRGSFAFDRGQEGIRSFESSPGIFRSFCGRCGSPVPDEQPDAPLFLLALGSFDDVPGARPLAHIYAGSNPTWLPIADQLPRFETMPSGYEIRSVPERPRPHASAGRAAGSCACARVTYELETAGAVFRHCHCSRCRRGRAAAHATNLVVEPAKFRFTTGEDLVEDYRLPEAKRFAQAFCRACGSALPRVNRERGYVGVPGGGLDDDPGLRPTEHIFVGSKAPWFEIPADGLPRHPEYAPTPS